MKRQSLIVMFCVFALAAASVVGGSFFDGGWRISVGAAYNAPAKVGLSFSPVKFTCNTPVPTGYKTRAEAEAEVGKQWVDDWNAGNRSRREFGDLVFVDADGRIPTSGSVAGGTANVRVLKSSWDQDSRSFILAHSEYEGDVETIHNGQGALRLNGSDETAQPGVMVELSRNLYHNEEWRFGVDLSFALSYFFRSDIYKDYSTQSSDTLRVYRDSAVTSIAPKSGRWNNTDDSLYYGSGGTAASPVFWGPEFETLSRVDYKDWQNTAALCVNGDYRDLEMMLALRPYYDLFDWLRFYATIGLAVSWSEFDLDVDYAATDSRASYSRDYDQWDVYGIGGLGLMLRWHDFCLGADFLARFFDDDLEIRDEIVQGSLRRGRWMFRGYIGYEF